MTACGDAIVELIAGVTERGVHHAVVLLRHSAREYHPAKHDLDNPLTDEGRALARRLGERLPKSHTLRGYASPPARCMETAELILFEHARRGGSATRHRPLEALGVFYVLDQMKMWRGMNQAGGLVPYMEQWFAGSVPADAMIAPQLAASLVLQVLAAKLAAPVTEQQLDICVSHDMTLYLLRDRLLGRPVGACEVDYLDGLVLFEDADGLRLAGQDGHEAAVALSPHF
jgi:phosphohistidine phosphatase SixA